MNRHSSAVLTRRVGTAGALLGLAAGLTQALVGDRIPAWSGAKADPVALGVLTLAMSIAALTGARWVDAAMTIRRRTAAAALVLVPAGLCASTAGRLWWLPGALLLTSGVLVVAGGDRAAWRGFLRASWPAGLLSALAAAQLLMAVATGSAVAALAGAAGLLVLVAAWVPVPRRRRLLLVALGALPFAALTWWSVVTPLVALLALGVAVALPEPPADAYPAGRRLRAVSG